MNNVERKYRNDERTRDDDERKYRDDERARNDDETKRENEIGRLLNLNRVMDKTQYL